MRKFIIRVVLPLISLGLFFSSASGDAFFAYLKTTDSIDPNAQPYVDRFLKLAAARGITPDISKLTIIMDYTSDAQRNATEKTVGQCYPFSFLADNTAKQLIKLDPSYWAEIDDATRESLVLHELGHCILGRWEHDDEMILDSDQKPYPRSLMNSINVGSYDYLIHQQYYIDELFRNMSPMVRAKTFKADSYCTPLDYKLENC